MNHRLGGIKRKQNLTPEQISEISGKAGIASGKARAKEARTKPIPS
jgi:hypothetical protein